MVRKIGLVGAGQIGGVLAFLLATRELVEQVAVYDVVEGLAQGKALDISHASKVLGFSTRVTGSSDIKIIEDSDIVVVTAGVPRKPGMSRDDLLKVNADIISGVAKDIKLLCPNSRVIVVTNPLDAMAWLMWKETGFDPQRVIGMAGVLDSARFAFHLAEKLGVSPTNVSATVLGGHGDDMVPIDSTASVEGVKLTDLSDKFVDRHSIDQVKNRVRFSGGEIVNLLKTGSAFFSPAASAFDMVKAIALDQKKFVSASCYLNGEYGLYNIYFGVPCVLGASGVEKIVEIPLSNDEKALLDSSASRVKELINKLSSNG